MPTPRGSTRSAIALIALPGLQVAVTGLYPRLPR